MSTREIAPEEELRRAVAPGGALESVRAEIEQEIAAEEKAAAAATAKEKKLAATALDDAKSEYVRLRDAQFAAAEAFCDVSEALRPAERAYKQAMRQCRRLELPVAPLEYDYFKQSQASASTSDEGLILRHRVQRVVDELRKGIFGI